MKNPALKFKNFNDFFKHQSKLYENAPCITDGEHGTTYSYREVNEIVNKTAVLLSELGIKKGDRFATLTQNCPEFLFLYLASMKLGTLIVPFVADLPLRGLAEGIREFGIRTLFYDNINEKKAFESKKLCSTILENTISIQSLLEITEKYAPNENLFSSITLKDSGSLYFSSGTTGIPKGIPQSPENLLTAAVALAKVYGFTSNDTQMGILPCYHTALVTYGLWPSIWVGSNFVLFKKFSKSNFWKNIAKYKISFVEVVPTVLSMLLNSAENVSRYDFSHLKFIGSGSASLPQTLHKRFEDTFGVLVANQYGLSETAPTHFNPSDKAKRKEGSIGKPMSMCVVKVVNERGEKASVGEIGEIAIRGDSVINGYYNNSKETKSSFRKGWFYTGDLGFRDTKDFYFLVGRKKEMINRGGAKIYPQEVDNVILSLPAVREAATIGVPDPTYGEKVVAYIVIAEQKTLSKEKIIQHCLNYLPSYKCPEKIFFVDEIPKTPSGKIIRRLLEEWYKKDTISL